ncbi:MAG TPA: NfeD family protein, partial [Candidatus Acidoferrales bacterium]|nr:NfeD family protein [Candidatus Acidoferrales bacterium]
LDGRQIRRPSGSATIAIKGASVAVLQLDTREKLVAVVTNPTIAYLLFLLGALAIMIEIFAPHGFVTGTIGFLAILASLAGIVDLPIQVAGAALLVAGMILLGLELKITSHGALTVIGLIAFIAGSFLVLPRMPGFAISAWAIVTVAILWAAMIGGVVRLVVRSRHAPVLTGVQRIAGKTGIAKTDIAPRGVVLVNGEDWDALADASPISRGERIAVDSVEGLTLHVRKIS